jgi:hypothetical protein
MTWLVYSGISIEQIGLVLLPVPVVWENVEHKNLEIRDLVSFAVGGAYTS